MFDFVFVLAANVWALTVHSTDVCFVSLTELIHSLDKIITLLSQIVELIIHKHFLLAGFHLLTPQSF